MEIVVSELNVVTAVVHLCNECVSSAKDGPARELLLSNTASEHVQTHGVHAHTYEISLREFEVHSRTRACGCHVYVCCCACTDVCCVCVLLVHVRTCAVESPMTPRPAIRFKSESFDHTKYCLATFKTSLPNPEVARTDNTVAAMKALSPKA